MKSETSTIKCKAIFSDDKSHRMLLRHEWEKGGKSAMIIMINPNTAYTLCMDLTTMLTINNLSKLGFGSVNIVNLYRVPLKTSNFDKNKYCFPLFYVDKKLKNRVFRGCL